MTRSGLHACGHFLTDFSDFIDGTLPLARRARIQAHLDCCEGCLRHLRAYRRGMAQLRIMEAEPRPDFTSELEARIRRLESAEARRAGDEARGGGSRLPATSFAVAAGLALVVFWSLGRTASDGGPNRAAAQDPPVSIASAIPTVADADPRVTGDAPEASRMTIARASEGAARPRVLRTPSVPVQTVAWMEPIEIREVEFTPISARSLPPPWMK